MKTLALYIQTSGPPVFLNLPGDYSRFHRVFINGEPEDPTKIDAYDELSDELYRLVYNDRGAIRLPMLIEPTRDWDFFIICGII